LESDRQLVQRVLAGERQAFAALVERYEHAVFATALKVLEDRQTAEDAAQNAFVAAYENLRRLHDPSAFGTWLLVIARNEALRLVRLRPRTVPLIDGHGASETGMQSSEVNEVGQMMQALDRLPAHDQNVLMLRYFRGHSVADIAQISGRSVGTVTKQISRALQKLRERLKGSKS
jgi:RNA polymerase sigma-70 factor (ECF subfamily)